jgi:hypothetical protein
MATDSGGPSPASKTPLQRAMMMLMMMMMVISDGVVVVTVVVVVTTIMMPDLITRHGEAVVGVAEEKGVVVLQVRIEHPRLFPPVQRQRSQRLPRILQSDG